MCYSLLAVCCFLESVRAIVEFDQIVKLHPKVHDSLSVVQGESAMRRDMTVCEAVCKQISRIRQPT